VRTTLPTTLAPWANSGQGDDIAPIPGTKRVSRVEENIAADGIELSPVQIDKLNNLTPAAGEHHNKAQVRMSER
jgi:diketogulonate reductase-like aldo/keto reductase